MGDASIRQGGWFTRLRLDVKVPCLTDAPGLQTYFALTHLS